MARFLAKARLTLDTLLSIDAGHAAIVVRFSDSLETGRYLALAIIQPPARFLVEPVFAGDFLPDIQWVRLRNHIDGALITYDDPVEGVVGSSFYLAAPNVWKLAYRDRGEQAGICHPAALQDANGDGRLDLVSYEEDPSPSACVTACWGLISQHTPLKRIAWHQIHTITTNSVEPAVLSNYKEYYQKLAKDYKAAYEWMLSEGRQELCQGDGITVEVLKGWEKRAREVTGEG